MLSEIPGRIRNYLYSDYEDDNKGHYPQGSIKGRVISLIDIPSQVIKSILVPALCVAIAVYSGSSAGLRITFKVIPFAFMSILPNTDHDYWSDRRATEWKIGKESIIDCLLETRTVFLSYVVLLGMIAVDIIGCTIHPNAPRVLRTGEADACHKAEAEIIRNIKNKFSS